MGIARSAGRLVGKLVNPSWKPPKPKPAWHENNNKITNIVARHKRGTNDFIVDSKNNNEHDLYIVDHNPDKSTTKYKKVATVGSFTRVDTGNTRTRTQSENPINSENRGISYSGLSAVVEHLRSGGYDVHALNKSNNAKKPVFQGNMVHPLSRHNTTYAENRYENYLRLKPKSDEAKSNDRFWSTQNKPKPQVQKALEYNPSPPKAPPSTSGDKLPRPSDGIRHSQSDMMELAKKLREESDLKKGSSQTNKDIATNVTDYLAKPPKGWPIYPTPIAPRETRRPVKLDVPITKPTVNPTVNPTVTPADQTHREPVKKNATAPIELPAKAVELPTGKDHLDYIRGLVEESKGKAWNAGIARDNVRGSQNPTILDPRIVEKLKNVEIPEFNALDFDLNSLTPKKLKELDNSVQARAVGESNRAAVASGKGMPRGNVVDDVHKYLVPKAQGDDRIEGFQALADRLEALNDPNLSKVIVRLRTSQDNLTSQREVLADAGTEKEKGEARKKADALAKELRRTSDPTGVVESSKIRNPKTGKPERQVLPLEMSTGAGSDIIEAINKGTGQFNKGTKSEDNTRGIGLKTLTVPTNLRNPDGSFGEYIKENIPHYTDQLGREVSDNYQSEQYFRNLAPDAELPVPTTPIDELHHRIASPLARLAGLQAANSSMVDNNPNATSDRFAPATPGMIVQSTDSEGKTVSDKPIMNTEEMVKARLHKMEESVGKSESDSYNSIRKILAETFNQEDADNLAKLRPKKQSRRIDKMVEQNLNDTVRRHATNYANPEQDTSGETNIFTANGGVDPRNLISLADHYGSTGHKNPMSKAIDDLLSDDPATKNIIQQINAYDRKSLENQFNIHQAGLAKNPDDPASQNAAAGVFNHMAQQGHNTEGVSPFVKDISAEEIFALAQAKELAKFNAPRAREAYVQTEPVPEDVPKAPMRSGLARRGKQPVVEQAAPQAAPAPPPQEDIGNRVQNFLPQDSLNPQQTAQESARAALNDPTVAPPAPAQEPQAPPPPTKMTKAEIDDSINVLMHAPSSPGGKPRVSFKTQREGNEFRRGFEAANEKPGALPPTQQPGVPAKEQKYRDAWYLGWSHAQLKLRKNTTSQPQADILAQVNSHIDPAAAKTGAKGKQPWEMTWVEFRSKQNEGQPEYIVRNSEGLAIDKELHRELISDALREGKPVPPEVLANYLASTPTPAPARYSLGGQLAPGKGTAERSRAVAYAIEKRADKTLQRELKRDAVPLSFRSNVPKGLTAEVYHHPTHFGNGTSHIIKNVKRVGTSAAIQKEPGTKGRSSVTDFQSGLVLFKNKKNATAKRLAKVADYLATRAVRVKGGQHGLGRIGDIPGYVDLVKRIQKTLD